jgi:hypothetical protein
VSLQGAKSVQFYTLNSNLSNWQQVGQDRGYVKVPAGSTLSASIDTTPTLVLSVAKDWKSNVPSGIMGYKLYPAGKTVYLSYDPAKSPAVYPQTGPLKGIGKFTPNFIMEDRTNTGLLKRNNIATKEIDQLAR